MNNKKSAATFQRNCKKKKKKFCFPRSSLDSSPPSHEQVYNPFHVGMQSYMAQESEQLAECTGSFFFPFKYLVPSFACSPTNSMRILLQITTVSLCVIVLIFTRWSFPKKHVSQIFLTPFSHSCSRIKLSQNVFLLSLL